MRAEKEWFSNITLCVDFCELHERTVPDRHHLPGVHTTVASFGTNEWLSLLNKENPITRKGFLYMELK